MSKDSKNKRKNKEQKNKTKSTTRPVLALYHSAWHFMTDSRGKTKANSVFTLNHRRGSSMLDTTTMINDDTDSVSDSDAQQPVLNTNVAITAENALMRSPWKNEMESRTDLNSYDTEEDANVIPRRSSFAGRTDPTRRKSAPSIGRKQANSRRNSIVVKTAPTLNMLTNSAQRPNRTSRIKWSTVGKKKSQKYHWSGTFCTRRTTNLSPRNARSIRSLDLSGHEDDPNENDRLLSYNYNREDFGKKRSASKVDDIFLSNVFDPPDSVENERIDNVGCQPCIDICGGAFDETDFKNYDVHRNNGSLSLFDVDLSLRQTVTDNVDEKDVVGTRDTDLYTNQPVVSTLYSQFSSTVDGGNGEERDDPRGARKFVDSKIKGRLRGREVTDDDTKKKSAVRSRCYKIWCFLSTLLKNAILFLLLPATYIIFFIYVQGIEGK